MVDSPPPEPSNPSKPFALRSALYTLGFLIFILGVVPSVAHLIGTYVSGEAPEASPIIRHYWLGFIELVGIAIFTIGLASYLACSAWLIYFGRGPHVEFDPPKVFVATGPYRWVRNPVVITLLFTVLGQAIFYQSAGIAVLLLVGCPIAHLQVTRIEEPRLRERFGESYADYCRRVHRWLPKPPQEFSTPPAR